jgi:glycosyltransferase involved in cell wall biosynthesis
MHSPQSLNKIALIIPAYNEAGAIKSVLEDVKHTFQGTKHAVDVVVVDDGSIDNTAEYARSGGAFVIRHILNSGSGAATATGLSFASQKGYQLAATLDADGQHKATDVLRGIERMLQQDYDLLIGSRLIGSGNMSRIKYYGNKGLTLITFILFGIKVTDSQSGLRIFSHHSLSALKWKTSGYEYCSEMLWRANQLGLKLGEFPIESVYTDYSVAKGQSNWNAFNIVRLLLKQRAMELFDE